MTTGKQLRDARVRAGFRSQQALADELGVSLRTITHWEATHVPPKEEARVRELLWPGPAPLAAYDDWELLNEIGRRMSLARRATAVASQTVEPEGSEELLDDSSDEAPGLRWGTRKPRPDTRG